MQANLKTCWLNMGNFFDRFSDLHYLKNELRLMCDDLGKLHCYYIEICWTWIFYQGNEVHSCFIFTIILKEIHIHVYAIWNQTWVYKNENANNYVLHSHKFYNSCENCHSIFILQYAHIHMIQNTHAKFQKVLATTVGLVTFTRNE